MADAIEFTPMIDFNLGIGESLIWDDARNILWFIDINAPAIFSIDPKSGNLARYDTPETVASMGLASGGKLVVALRNSVHLFDPDSGQYDLLCTVETGRPENRLNDGRVGPDGAFWVGSMHEFMPYSPTATFYRVSPTGDITAIRPDIHVSNGLAWSPDGRTMYHADSVLTEIRAYDFDPATGRATSPRTFTSFDAGIGHPDGACVDAEGCYWSAGITAGRLNRFSPEGELIASLEVPVRWPTMPCFGGTDLRTLFLISLNGPPEGNDGRIGEGTLISMDVGVAGIPEHIFGPRA